MRPAIHAISLIFLIAASSLSARAEDLPEWRFACNYFPPLKMHPPEKGPHPGIDIELLTSIANSLGHRAHFEFFPWKRAYAMVRNGEADALCSCSHLPEREADFVFTDPVGNIDKGIFARRQSDLDDIRQLSDLAGKKVGVVSGYNLEVELEEQGIQGVELANSEELLFKMLEYERVNYVYAFKEAFLYTLNHQDHKIPIGYLPLQTAPYFVCFSKAKPQAEQRVKQFNEALARIREEGELQQIRKRYLGSPW